MKLGDNIVILKNVKRGGPIMSKGINSRKVAVIGTGFAWVHLLHCINGKWIICRNELLIDADKSSRRKALNVPMDSRLPDQ